MSPFGVRYFKGSRILTESSTNWENNTCLQGATVERIGCTAGRGLKSGLQGGMHAVPATAKLGAAAPDVLGMEGGHETGHSGQGHPKQAGTAVGKFGRRRTSYCCL